MYACAARAASNRAEQDARRTADDQQCGPGAVASAWLGEVGGDEQRGTDERAGDREPGRGARALGPVAVLLGAPAKAMFDEMDRYITAMQQALDSAGSDCAKLTTGLRALDTDGYLQTMKQAAVQMKPNMTPACQAAIEAAMRVYKKKHGG